MTNSLNSSQSIGSIVTNTPFNIPIFNDLSKLARVGDFVDRGLATMNGNAFLPSVVYMGGTKAPIDVPVFCGSPMVLTSPVQNDDMRSREPVGNTALKGYAVKDATDVVSGWYFNIPPYTNSLQVSGISGQPVLFLEKGQTSVVALSGSKLTGYVRADVASLSITGTPVTGWYWDFVLEQVTLTSSANTVALPGAMVRQGGVQAIDILRGVDYRLGGYNNAGANVPVVLLQI